VTRDYLLPRREDHARITCISSRVHVHMGWAGQRKTRLKHSRTIGESAQSDVRGIVSGAHPPPPLFFVAAPGIFPAYSHKHACTHPAQVVALWKSNEGQTYERAIQLQCVEILGRRAFVGINFLSRQPIVSPREMSEMFQQARVLGLAGIGGSPAEMEIVRHEGCRYPTSSGNRESRSWGSAWGVNTLAL